MPLSLVLSVLTIVPLVTFTPLRTLRETPVTGLLFTASLIVPEIVPEVQLSESILRVETTSVWLSVASVAEQSLSIHILRGIEVGIFTPGYVHNM